MEKYPHREHPGGVRESVLLKDFAHSVTGIGDPGEFSRRSLFLTEHTTELLGRSEARGDNESDCGYNDQSLDSDRDP
jgi:hypothetical protein